MEEKSVRRLGISRPKKGLKVVDLAANRMGPNRPKYKRLGNKGMIM